jgi:protein SCO1/2
MTMRRLVATVVVTLTLAGCGSGSPGEPTHAAGHAAPEAELRVLGSVPDFELVDEQGRAYGSADLRGHVWLATFIFTRCGSTCPLQTAAFGRLQEAFAEPPLDETVRLVSLTVDPAYDTSEVLQEYAARAHYRPGRWKFLTGEREAIWSLCKAGFKLPVTDELENANELIVHSQSIALVDGEGRVRGYYDALDDEELDDLRRDAVRLAETAAVPG